MKEKNIRAYIYSIIVVLSFILVAIGATMAALVYADVIGNESNGSVEVKTAYVTAVFNQTHSFDDKDIIPGWSNYIEFQIVNTSKMEDAIGRYKLVFDISSNDINDNNFVYKLTGISTKDGKVISESSTNQLVNTNEIRVPSVSSVIGTGIINTGVTHSYRLDINFKESGENQNDLQGKTFIGMVTAIAN